MPRPSFWRRWLASLTRPRQPEAGPIKLGRRRIYILPTRAGILYGAVLLVMLIGAINYDLALGHALVFLLASQGLVGMLHTHRNLLQLEITPATADSVCAGELAHFRLIVSNHSKRPRICLEWSSCENDQPAVIQQAEAESSTPVIIPIPAQTRGWLHLPPLKVASRYPLGLFQAWTHPWPEIRCLVYPRPHFSPLPLASGAGLTNARQNKEGQDDFAGLRERQPADSLRHIAWKAAARDMGHRPLLVKVFSGGSQEQLWLDWTATEGNLEQRVSILAGWVMDAEAAGLDYGLSLPGQQIAPGHGAPHRHHCLEALALYSA